jgi:hypothetical protein
MPAGGRSDAMENVKATRWSMVAALIFFEKLHD